MPERVGEQFGNYQLTSLLGRGAFADVYLADHLHLQTQAAVKVLHVQLTDNHIERFRQEARLIARLNHPHIIRVLDFGLKEATPFLVMEYAQGGTLRTRHARGTRLTLEQVVTYVKQVAAALSYAHQQRLVHRDVKPENMLLNQHNEVLLSDFGLAVIQPSSATSITQGGAGTPMYMAPEQIRGKPRAASDQYALAVVVYEWLCGEFPFQGSLFEVWYQHLHDLPPRLTERIPGLSPMVEDVIFRGLAKDPQQRFASVQEFAEMLEAASLSPQLSSTHQQIQGSLATQLMHEDTTEQTQPLVTTVSQGEENLETVSTHTWFSPRSRAMDVEQGVSSTQAPPRQPLPMMQQRSHHLLRRASRFQWLLFAGLPVLVLGLLLVSLYVPSWAQQPGPKPTQTPAQTPQEIYARYTSGPPTQTDPLLDGTVWPWFNGAPTYGTCTYSDAYHASAYHRDSFASCVASNQQFVTFAYQVQVTIRSGDAAGLLVDFQPPSGPYPIYDAFLFCRDTRKSCEAGSVWFTHAQGGGAKCDTSATFDCNTSYPFINTALGSQNTLTIVVLSRTVYLYINGHSVGIAPRISSKGSIGVAVYNEATGTDATFSHAKLWILPG